MRKSQVFVSSVYGKEKKFISPIFKTKRRAELWAQKKIVSLGTLGEDYEVDKMSRSAAKRMVSRYGPKRLKQINPCPRNYVDIVGKRYLTLKGVKRQWLYSRVMRGIYAQR